MAVGPLASFNIDGTPAPGKFDVDSPSQQRALFKTYYDKISENTFNTSTPLFSMIKRPQKKFTGNQFVEAVVLSHQGGAGSGVLPRAGGRRTAQLTMLSRRCYQRVSIQGEAIQASKNNMGAFVQATKFSLGGAVKNFVNNAARQLYGDGSGFLGYGTGVAAGISVANGNEYTVRINNRRNAAGATAAQVAASLKAIGFIPANFEEGSIVQFVGRAALAAAGSSAVAPEGGQGEDNIANLLEVIRVNESTGEVTVKGTSTWLATRAAGNNDATKIIREDEGFVLQRSHNREMHGLGYAVNHAVDANVYGIGTENRRWSALQTSAGRNEISPIMMRKLYLDLDKRFGCKKGKYMFTTSYLQYYRILAYLESSNGAREGQKFYTMKGRNGSKKLVASMSFSGLAIHTEHGLVPVFPDRFCPDGMVYLLNVDYIKTVLRPGGFRWLQYDGRVLLREQDRDGVEARYGGYGNNIIYPFAHALLYNLSVA